MFAFISFFHTLLIIQHKIVRLLVNDVGFAIELMREGAMQTVLSGIVSAFAWPAYLVSAADFIDSKWSIAIDR